MTNPDLLMKANVCAQAAMDALPADLDIGEGDSRALFDRLSEAVVMTLTLLLPQPDTGRDLIVADGVVVITLERLGEIEEVARFSSITSAEAYLNQSNRIDPDALEGGDYTIAAPHGLGADSEAVALVKKLGYQLFYSMGHRYYAPPGVGTTGNDSGKGWKSAKGDETFEEMALRILATIEP